MNLNVGAWKKFSIGEIFIIRNGCGITAEEIKCHPGELNAVQSGEKNNGVMGCIDEEYCREMSYVYTLNPCLTVARSGSAGSVTFQPKGCCVGDSAKILSLIKPSKDENVYVFLKTVLMCNKYRYTYARKVTEDNYRNETIFLPVDENNEPNYKFMSDYINSLDGNVKDIPDYFLEDGYEKAAWFLDNIDQKIFELKYARSKYDNVKKNLHECRWSPFKLGDIVDSVDNGKSYNASELVVSDSDDYVAYVTRTDQNNGISMYVQNENYVGKEKAGAITIGDTTSTIFYQSIDFITGPHIIVVRASWFNVYTALFIITLLNLEKYRYPVYGRAFTKKLIENTILNLPIDENGKPDYLFMENYIKGCAFSCNLA